jgi:hypothetical protein
MEEENYDGLLPAMVRKTGDLNRNSSSSYENHRRLYPIGKALAAFSLLMRGPRKPYLQHYDKIWMQSFHHRPIIRWNLKDLRLQMILIVRFGD